MKKYVYEDVWEIRAKKELECCECHETISKTELYKFSKIENKRFNTCQVCFTLRKRFCCKHGTLAKKVTELMDNEKINWVEDFNTFEQTKLIELYDE